MAYQKLQVGNALKVIPSDTINIPNPALRITSSVNTGFGASTVTDSTVNFLTLNVTIGSVVINDTDGTIATVTSVAANTLGLSANIFSATGKSYSVYSMSSREGSVLYVGTGGTMSITTWGGQTVTMVGVISGSYVPVQVARVNATDTTASNIIAFW